MVAYTPEILEADDILPSHAEEAQARLRARGVQVVLSDDEVRSVFLDTRDWTTLARVYGISFYTVKSIKTRKRRITATEGLTLPPLDKRIAFGDVVARKLTADSARAIFRDRRSYPQIAAAFDISIETVRAIKRRKRWRRSTIGLKSPLPVAERQTWIERERLRQKRRLEKVANRRREKQRSKCDD